MASPSPVPLPGPLVVKNGSNMCACTSGVMPVPAVPDDQAHARPHVVTLVESKLSSRDLGELDGERAARRHRVARVHGQVEEDLFDLGRVRVDRRHVGGRPHVQLDVLADEALEDGLETLHELVQVEDAGLQQLLAAQGQELPGERGCAIRRVRDQVDIAPLRILGGELHEQEGGPAGDDGQEIVEVVGHAAGQSAHRLHLLRLAELGLGVLETLRAAPPAPERSDAPWRRARIAGGSSD